MESVGIIFGCIAWIVVGRFGSLTVAILLELFLWSRGSVDSDCGIVITVICGVLLNILSVISSD